MAGSRTLFGVQRTARSGCKIHHGTSISVALRGFAWLSGATIGAKPGRRLCGGVREDWRATALGGLSRHQGASAKESSVAEVDLAVRARFFDQGLSDRRRSPTCVARMFRSKGHLMKLMLGISMLLGAFALSQSSLQPSVAAPEPSKETQLAAASETVGEDALCPWVMVCYATGEAFPNLAACRAACPAGDPGTRCGIEYSCNP